MKVNAMSITEVIQTLVGRVERVFCIPPRSGLAYEVDT